LQNVAILLNLPGKLGMSGDKVWDCWLEGGIEQIRNYCETDVLNTFLVYLRFQLIRGHLTKEHYLQENQRIRDYLSEQTQSHFKEFLSAWSEVVI
jgi:predicted PolB exonuclease-like 3'-5' exonuclease